MRTALLVALGTLVWAGSASHAPLAAAASPCATATAACTEWVALGRGSARSMIYRTFSLDVRNDAVRARGGHGSRHQSQRGSLLQHRDRGGVPGRRARRRRRHLAALYGLQRQAAAERSRLELHRRQLALGRDGRHASGPLVVRFHGPDRDEAREQTRLSQPSRHRRRRTFRRRPVRGALSDVESRARLHRHADVVRRRQSVELCVAERDASAAGRRCGAGQCQGSVGDGQAAHEVLVRPVRGKRRVPELRPLAGGLPEQNRGLHRRKPATSS